MATKSNLVTTLNGFITAVITQLKHRNANNAIVDEIYPISVTDTQTSETYTTKAGVNLIYFIRITKSGNIAHISGIVRNTTPNILSSQNIFMWKTNEFTPKSGVNDFSFIAYNGANQATLFLNNNVLALVGSILPTSTNYTFDFKTYITND